MPHDEKPPGEGIAVAARDSWLGFRTGFQELRPDLYRFCRNLTRSPWDAEDLVQDTLMRAFVALGSQYGQHIERPRAWLLRIAANSWLDRQRHRAEPTLGAEPHAEPAPEPSDPQAQREAAGSLLGLSPRERVVIVLKEAFDFSLEEVAEALGTTPGTVKSALHRGRQKLSQIAPETTIQPTPAVIDSFCAAFNAGDLERLTALLLDSAKVELPGVAVDFGVAASRRPEAGILYHSLLAPLSSGVPAEYLGDYLPAPPRAEAHFHRGEQIVLIWHQHRSGDAVRGFARFELDPDSARISSLRQYYFSPEAMAEVCSELGVAQRSNGYGT